MKAPGSPSSALQITYLSVPAAALANFHFAPVGNPPPPRPRSPEASTSLNHFLWRHPSSTLAIAW